MPANTIALIQGVDLSLGAGPLDRPTVLETADWLAAYRRQYNQSAELEVALNTLRRASRLMVAGAAAPAVAA
ncbi:MAG: hypothetical protein MUF25_26405 [Pirellulaceae bacterium]|jgi:hypothetical protein|nr:hypothetical protein [Pirellulaceae bacterium]